MPNIALSVVCPIYNCEEFVQALVQSLIVAANSHSIEFLFVDDCSTDDSRRVCQQALEQRKEAIRFNYRILAHERNRGLSAARNTGIVASKGRYIGFLDGDDVLLPGYADYVLPELDLEEGGCPEILEFSFKEFVVDEEIGAAVAAPADAAPAKLEPHFYSGKKRYNTLFQHGFFAWLRVYQRELVEAVMFIEDGRAYEDIRFSMDMVARARQVKRMNVALLGYRKSAGSITAIRDKRFLDQFLQLTEGMKRNREKLGGGFALESRYLFKLFIVLLKAMKIRPANDRLEFYRAASAYAHCGDSLWSKVSTAASRSFSSLLFYAVRTLRLG